MLTEYWNKPFFKYCILLAKLIRLERPLACNFIKKETLAPVFSSEFCKISKNTFFTEHLRTTASVFRKKVPDMRAMMISLKLRCCNFSLTNKKTVYRLDLQLPTAKQLDFTYTYWITWWWTNINHGVDGKPINGSKQGHYFGRCRFCHVNPPWTELQNGYYKY